MEKGVRHGQGLLLSMNARIRVASARGWAVHLRGKAE